MNRIQRRKFILEFDVWEPLQKVVDVEMDSVVKYVKQALTHAGNVKITPVETVPHE